MTRKLGLVARVVVMFAMGLTFVGASFAQTTTSATVNARKFEVISVDGDQLVVRDDKGTSTITVPDGFRFTVDGKALAVGDLKPGMKGTAVVTTTTTVTPVVITEIKKGVVLSVGPASLIVKDEADGVRKRFTQSQLNDRGIKILNKDGKVTHVSDVKVGDEITATIVTQGPPVVVTEQEVQATLAQAAPATAATPAPAKTEAPATPAPTAAPAASAEPAAPAPAMAAAPAASAEPPAAPPPAMATTAASAPAESGGLGTTGWVLIILLIAVALYFFSRRKKPQ
jgi:hypothetical protein